MRFGILKGCARRYRRGEKRARNEGARAHRAAVCFAPVLDSLRLIFREAPEGLSPAVRYSIRVIVILGDFTLMVVSL